MHAQLHDLLALTLWIRIKISPLKLPLNTFKAIFTSPENGKLIPNGPNYTNTWSHRPKKGIETRVSKLAPCHSIKATQSMVEGLSTLMECLLSKAGSMTSCSSQKDRSPWDNSQFYVINLQQLLPKPKILLRRNGVGGKRRLSWPQLYLWTGLSSGLHLHKILSRLISLKARSTSKLCLANWMRACYQSAPARTCSVDRLLSKTPDKNTSRSIPWSISLSRLSRVSSSFSTSRHLARPLGKPSRASSQWWRVSVSVRLWLEHWLANPRKPSCSTLISRNNSVEGNFLLNINRARVVRMLVHHPLTLQRSKILLPKIINSIDISMNLRQVRLIRTWGCQSSPARHPLPRGLKRLIGLKMP